MTLIYHHDSVVGYPIELGLPDGNSEDLAQAADAVKQEYLSSIKWKRLSCREVVSIGDGSVFKLDLGQTVEFDWTWEGATAFRPSNPNYARAFPEDPDGESSSVWCGEVVEVDEAQGFVFVWVADLDRPPTTGAFFVRPFEFLAHLHDLYSGPAWKELQRLMPGRLLASRGNVHPLVGKPSTAFLSHLRGVWAHSWSVIWGPPGTGKTHTVGQQVAECLTDPVERVLVVSTTNKSTDESAFSIGRAVRDRKASTADSDFVLRIGKGAHLEAYRERGLEGLLTGTETELLHQVGVLTKQMHATHDAEERALLRKEIQQLKRAMRDASFNICASREVRVVVATVFRAMAVVSAIREQIAVGRTPFTTVIIDEAGLISRAAVAALSLLASRRVVLAGDSKQLAPISRICRILPTAQASWLASSGLSHLLSLKDTPDAVCVLRQQHRMHPQIAAVVSNYQYEGQLENGSTVLERSYASPTVLTGQPRSIWYVLDDDGTDYPAIRAERGPGHRSWIRTKTRDILRKLFLDGSLRSVRGLYVTPFIAQARDIRAFLAEGKIDSWSASTVHSQQGTEADVVIFDTVNAGSTAWPFEEWKRLANVGLSRAREFFILLASRAEMREPYLRSLLDDVSPQVLHRAASPVIWTKVKARQEFNIPEKIAGDCDRLGYQITARKLLRPVMSAEQQRLCGYSMDGKPRLVRGVAGSGKTAVLAHWLVKVVRRMTTRRDMKIWVIFANHSLTGLIREIVEESWANDENEAGNFPWETCVQLWHIGHVLRHLGIRMPEDDSFDYDGAAKLYLAKNRSSPILPRCSAMFIDEAQDLGPSTLQVLTRLVVQTDKANPNSRAINIFYDNAQNVYGRRTPRWSEIGLDMRGRSSVMQESFRSTRPIIEFSLNALYRLLPEELAGDHGELIGRELIMRTTRGGREWWSVRFNQVHGPVPVVRSFASLSAEFDELGSQLVSWIATEGIRPNDICIIYNGEAVRDQLEAEIGAKLRTVGARLEVQVGSVFTRDANTVVASTAQSFKGYDSEVVVVVGADKFCAREKGILANNLYVAMTRARSILAVYGVMASSENGRRIMSVLTECLELLTTVPCIEADDF